jgi:beta-alanine degradation protein BauB
MQSRSVCVFWFFGSFALLGQDVVGVAPAGMVKVEYDDPQVRVLRFTEAPGAKLPMHSHPAYVAVALTNDVSRYTFPDGRSSKEKTKAGQAQFSQPVTHASENIGGTAMESVMVELKTKPTDTVLTGTSDMAKVNRHACKVEKDNEYVRITRVKLPSHGKLAMHSHPSTNVAVYVSGGHSKATTSDGKSEESTIAPGTVKVNPSVEHSNENLDDKPTEAVLVELKTAK